MSKRLFAGANKLAWQGLSAGLVTITLIVALQAQPTGGTIMTNVSLFRSQSCTTVNVAFSIPIRYVSHFPQIQGKEVRIRLKPIAAGSIEASALFKREGFSPVNAVTPLENVVYEGDMAGGPYLSLQFSHNVDFTVVQGRDFRSMAIRFGDTAADCAPPAKN